MNESKHFIHNDYIEFREYLLNENSNIKFLKKDSFLIAPSDALDYIYFILDGMVVNTFIYKNGYEKAFTAHGKNTIVPLYSPTNLPIEGSITLKVIKDCHVISFPKKKFADLLQKNKDLNNQMYVSYIKHINYLIYENLSLITNNGLTRISIFLLNYIKDHNPIDNIIPISQQEIANLVGLNLINTSRNIKTLKDMHIVKTGRNKIIVLDIEKLSKLC